MTDPDPDPEIQQIALRISKDPSLTAGILKLVNSSQYVLNRRVDNTVEMVNLVGLKQRCEPNMLKNQSRAAFGTKLWCVVVMVSANTGQVRRSRALSL